uniref:Uncharacterized protein n=1 Tax=Arundo donax TaxID=35708 RepID=A0A0A9BI87_ARUDO
MSSPDYNRIAILVVGSLRILTVIWSEFKLDSIYCS